MIEDTLFLPKKGIRRRVPFGDLSLAHCSTFLASILELSILELIILAVDDVDLHGFKIVSYPLLSTAPASDVSCGFPRFNQSRAALTAPSSQAPDAALTPGLIEGPTHNLS